MNGVISGASSVSGAATAHQLSAVGYKVVLVWHSRSAVEEIAADIGNGAVVETSYPRIYA
jgi:NADP-dependent 3-hydroxy acid dehydrogenase YdfG